MKKAIYYNALLLYNFISLATGIFLSPIIILVVLAKKKYRGRLFKRLGFFNTITLNEQTTIWVHTLSIGETTSALPLLKRLRETYPEARIVLSVTTSSGQKLAHEQATPYTDVIIPAPLDLMPTVLLYVHKIRPDLFILVETDFWPNWLLLMKWKQIPSFLVNGRISDSSFKQYRRFSFLFNPLFNTFSALCMQTEMDRNKMHSLGIPANKIFTLGNLKFDTQNLEQRNERALLTRRSLGLPADSLIWICGSTHHGEEQIIVEVFKRLHAKFPQVYLVIAPRNIERSGEIDTLLASTSFSYTFKSRIKEEKTFQVLILDTLGELAAFYHKADIAFIGGSLVPQGGHNPIEAAIAEIPILFGRYMEDFLEIAEDITQSGGAIQVASANDLFPAIESLISDRKKREQTGKMALKWVRSKQGVIENHLKLFAPYLQVK